MDKIFERKVNNTYQEIDYKCLHEDFYKFAEVNPNEICIVYEKDDDIKELTYGELRKEVLKATNLLIDNDIKVGENVSVIMPKKIEQVIAVLAILSAGAVYVPINFNHPLNRINRILESGNIKKILTTNELKEREYNADIIDIQNRNNYDSDIKYKKSNLDDLAYIIYTSGSTGNPKGVMISHKSAYNTIDDINTRFGVTKDDMAITISELDFDLSVYDILGLLSVGAKIFVVDEEYKKEPSYWANVVKKYNITLWNTVPALMDMLLSIEDLEGKTNINKVFLSGDWIKVDLGRKILKAFKECCFVSMGGATEASIWSIYNVVKEISDDAKTILYGKPLANQKFRIVNENDCNCQNKEIGELWIGGIGVAKGYFNEEELTKNQFVSYQNEIWYKTGDLGMYHEDDNIEFVGRKDTQVKLNGYRIELGEIENNAKTNEYINNSISFVDNEKIISLISPYIADFEAKDLKVDNNITDIDTNEFIKYELDVLKIIFNLCNIDNLVTNKKKLKRENNLFNYWTNYLVSKDVIKRENNLFIKSTRYNEVKNHLMSDNHLTNKFYKKIDFIKTILNKEKPSIELFEELELTPEYASFCDEETKYYANKIIDCINNSAKDTKDIHIGVFGVGSGFYLNYLIENINKNTKITVFDSSKGLLLRAKSNITDESNLDQIEFKLLDEDIFISKEIAYLDYVVSLGTLHTYKNTQAILDNMNILSKNNAKLFFIEYLNLSPIAMISSAILEDGFFDMENKNPLIKLNKLINYFKNSKLKNITMENINKKSTIFISAENKIQNSKYDKKEILAYLEKKLPLYMLPNRILYLINEPLSSNGKLDRKKALEYYKSNIVEIKDSNIEFEDFEKDMANIWENELAIYNFDREDSFFMVGGDSILATRLIAYINREYDINITLKEILDNPKFKDISKLVKDKIDEDQFLVEGAI
ncbi:amino acid adenylation domain-containing protein [Peptostreptococcaceae bacterium AGR-M142]